ncbi:MAG: polysaccharide deacetylase family protein, partial [Proteobacteria bacterium]|nr:polysaccharide deacetylase family protein [Pseudomonadota bacterium]
MMGARPRIAPLFALGMVVAAFGPPPPAEAADSAVVFMYHRFGETSWPSTNIRIDQFEAHLKELSEGGYKVLALPTILSALKRGEELPDKTIALTIDDAYLSVYTVAWPRLKAARFPFTLFVATNPIDANLRNYMNWDQIRELAKAGVTIGSQTARHLHMVDSSPRRNAADLKKSNARFAAELGEKPKLFAYPYGEASLAVKTLVIAEGFVAAFGQHSGVVHAKADFFYLPRFALNEAYGKIDRFRLAANALPLPVSEITPRDPLLTDNPPAFGFTVDPSLKQIHRLACYHSGQGKLPVERLGRRVEVRPKLAFPPGRTRINCT